MNLFSANFDSGNSATSMGMVPEGNNTTKVADVAGHRAVEISLDHYGDADPMRTELQPKPLPSTHFDNGLFAHMGESYTYALSTYLPPGWQADGADDIIMQWHDMHDAGEAWKNPAVALRITTKSDGPHFMVDVKGDADAFTPASGNRYDLDKSYDLGPISGAVGKWTDWQWDITWGYDNTGDLTLRRDGNVVLDLPNQANSFNDALGPYFKFGLYKWDWASSGDTGPDSRTIYFDNVSIESGHSGGAAVAPEAPDSTGTGSEVIGNDLVLRVSEDAYKGHAQYTVSVDGKQIGDVRTASASHDQGDTELINLGGGWSAEDHTVTVAFLNDLYGGANGADRNLYIDGAAFGDVEVPGAAEGLFSRGATASFTIQHDQVL
jgi:hypothetical protein